MDNADCKERNKLESGDNQLRKSASGWRISNHCSMNFYYISFVPCEQAFSCSKASWKKLFFPLHTLFKLSICSQQQFAVKLYEVCNFSVIRGLNIFPANFEEIFYSYKLMMWLYIHQIFFLSLQHVSTKLNISSKMNDCIDLINSSWNKFAISQVHTPPRFFESE